MPFFVEKKLSFRKNISLEKKKQKQQLYYTQ